MVIREGGSEFLAEFGFYCVLALFFVTAGLMETDVITRIVAIYVGETMLVGGLLVVAWRCLFSRPSR